MFVSHTRYHPKYVNNFKRVEDYFVILYITSNVKSYSQGIETEPSQMRARSTALQTFGDDFYLNSLYTRSVLVSQCVLFSQIKYLFTISSVSV